jgi:hypothetical protein
LAVDYRANAGIDKLDLVDTQFLKLSLEVASIVAMIGNNWLRDDVDINQSSEFSF